MEKETQKGTGLKPRQRKAISVLAQGGVAAQAAAWAGVAESELDGWIEQPSFTQALEDAARQYAAAAWPRVWGALLERCEKGELAAIKLYFELQGKAQATGNGALAAVCMAARIIDDLPQEKERQK